MRSYSLLALFSVLALVSCKKGGDAISDYGQGAGWCRIKGIASTIHNAPPGMAQFQYNSDGSIASKGQISRLRALATVTTTSM